jgi:hypothetical protein
MRSLWKPQLVVVSAVISLLTLLWLVPTSSIKPWFEVSN